jgi:hypothetical protein
MSGDHDISLLEFARAFRAEAERHYIHPMAAQRCHELLNEMFSGGPRRRRHRGQAPCRYRPVEGQERAAMGTQEAAGFQAQAPSAH